jgi:cation diffusion facilitator CzcD-associated flavoprotein CzcO
VAIPPCANRYAVVIGAGPAGLAVAARLQAAGVPFVVLEQSGRVGSSWRQRYDRLHLHTHGSVSALPFWPFPSSFPEYVSARDLADYYEGYAAAMFGDRLRLNTSVASVRREADAAWLVEASDGRQWRAAAVVICTGQVPRRVASPAGMPCGQPA